MTVARLQSSHGIERLIGLRLREISLPDGTLIAMIRRGDDVVIPRGGTTLEGGDRITVIGKPDGISALRRHHGEVAHR